MLFALGSTVVLVALHLLAPHIRRLPLVPEDATASFAGGLAVSYVFLHLLPELSAGSRELREVLGDAFSPSPLLRLSIFAIALLGFVVLYGLERLAQRSRGVQAEDERRVERGGASTGVFKVHLGSFMVYNAIIAYTLATNWRVSPAFAVLFTVAIGLHFVLTDRGLEEHYGDLFDRWPPRLLLAAGLVAGWALGALLAPTSTVVVSVLTAALAGGILLNVFKEEIPSTRRSHFGWFLVGVVFYSLLLGGVTMLEEHGGGREDASVSRPQLPIG